MSFENVHPRIVVIGGIAGGMSFAARARRLAEHASIVVLDKGPYVSFANCGLPYYLGGDITERETLILQTPQSLSAALNLDVRTEHEVLSLDAEHHQVQVRDLTTGQVYTEEYDIAVLAPGAVPIRPPLPGIDLPQVRTLRSLPDVDELATLVAAKPRHAVVVGAGFIGLETAEALRNRDIDVTVVESADHVLPPLDAELAHPVTETLRRHGCDVRLGVSVTGFTISNEITNTDLQQQNQTPKLQVELSDGSKLPADLVALAMGVRPDSGLASKAGIRTNERGAILVDEHFRTNANGVYAIGDAIAVRDAITGEPAVIPLAGPANRQGRDLANLLLGVAKEAAVPASMTVLGTAIVRVFDTVAAATGRSERALTAAGITHQAVHLHPNNHAGYYPGARPMHLKVIFAPDGRLLGAQAVGGAGVDKRIDVLATAIRAGLTVTDIADLELSYAPPFGSAKDPINMAGFIASNVLDGTLNLWYPHDLNAKLTPPEGTTLLDTRSEPEFAAGHLPGAYNIPHTELRSRLDEVPAGPVWVYCAAGFRSYLASRILRQNGWGDVRSLSGGMATLAAARPDAVPMPG